MPIYEYECTACGAIEEVVQNFSDKALKKCPHCSGKLQKLISQSTLKSGADTSGFLISGFLKN